jgi:hypothetical protein
VDGAGAARWGRGVVWGGGRGSGVGGAGGSVLANGASGSDDARWSARFQPPLPPPPARPAEDEPLPGDWKRMPEFDRLLLFRCLRPDRLTAALRKFVSAGLGAHYCTSQVRGRSHHSHPPATLSPASYPMHAASMACSPSPCYCPPKLTRIADPHVVWRRAALRPGALLCRQQARHTHLCVPVPRRGCGGWHDLQGAHFACLMHNACAGGLEPAAQGGSKCMEGWRWAAGVCGCMGRGGADTRSCLWLLPCRRPAWKAWAPSWA